MILDIVTVVANLIDKLIPDKAAAAQAKAALAVLEQKGELNLLKEQIRANREEARHASIFVAGWRPWIGWICGASLAIGALVKLILPALIVIVTAFGAGDTEQLQALLEGLDTIDVEFFYPILFGLLGLGGLRTFEKYKGIARMSMKD
jgi:hypothetical protein